MSTSLGDVRGRHLGSVRHFVGVPYAAPPVGARRFAPPEAAPAWDGVRDATSRGATAPQKLRAVPGLAIEPLVGTGWTPETII
ncbi:carboxylesterase family protein [Sphingomonas sp. LR60]|uniref:carboxylesterase family protein n=1 Tax=Sphingomonas sp. LR60 TaxID=3050233 RepID=UPI002FE17DB0